MKWQLVSPPTFYMVFWVLMLGGLYVVIVAAIVSAKWLFRQWGWN